jgi:V/A-type H+-transporting ATPase subunit G/H
MSFEAITTVREAEARAKQIKTEAAQSAAEAIEAAELDGKAAVEAALEKAREELRTLRSKSDEKATQDAEALAATTKDREAVMRSRAEAKLDQAASLIVERIVNS